MKIQLFMFWLIVGEEGRILQEFDIKISWKFQRLAEICLFLYTYWSKAEYII